MLYLHIDHPTAPTTPTPSPKTVALHMQFTQIHCQFKTSDISRPSLWSGSASPSCTHAPWIFEFGASFHMTSNVSLLDTCTHFSHVHSADGTHLPITRYETIISTIDHSRRLTLSTVFVALSVCLSLINVGCLCTFGLIISLSSIACLCCARFALGQISSRRFKVKESLSFGLLAFPFSCCYTSSTYVSTPSNTELCHSCLEHLLRAKH